MNKTERLIKRLKQGWTTPIDALNAAGTMKLSTRVGELRKAGYIILDKWVCNREYKTYRMVKAK